MNLFKLKIDPSLRRLAGYLVPHKATIALAVFFMITAGLGASLIASLLGKLTDAGFYEQDPWIIVAAPIGLILIAVLHGGSTFLSNYLLARVSQAVLLVLRKQIFHSILRWPASNYRDSSTAAVSSKFVLEANMALTNATKSAIILVRGSCQVLTLSLLLFWHDWQLALVSIALAPCIAGFLRWINKKLKSTMASSQTSVVAIMGHVKQSYDSERLIKMNDTFEYETERFRDINEGFRQLMVRMTRVSSLGMPVTQLITMVGVAVVLTFAMIQTNRGVLTIGEFVTFLTALLLIMPPLRQLAGLNADLVMMTVASSSVFSMLDKPFEEDKGTEELANVKGHVVFEDVSLQYPKTDKAAVSHLNLDIPAGSSLALVGLSGSGKTTTVNMLPRFWNPTEGRILIDGVDTQSVTLKSLRQQIAIVSQDAVIFDGTIKENILYGNPQATDEAVNRAVKAAALDTFVATLPQGLDTPVGEAGDRLSGGQKQRLSIARALLKNAPILILDEATSALDSETEKQIKQALDELMRNRTTLMVAHRLSTVENADRIVVMQDGRVIESGTYDELRSQGGVFARLVTLQSLGATGGEE